MDRTVFLAEKKSAALAIAKAFGLDEEPKNNGFFEGKIKDQYYIIAYSNGHCIELKEPEDIDLKYKTWRLEDLPIIFTENHLQVKEDKEVLFNKIAAVLKTASIIVNAGDAGREGELIQRWIIKMAGCEEKPLYRLWTQSLTKEAILRAASPLSKVSAESAGGEGAAFNNLYRAGQMRAILDKFLGYNYSRGLTKSLKADVTVSYGRCQSPIVSAIVKRDREIEEFKPEKFSYIKGDFSEDKNFIGVLIGEDGKRKTYSCNEGAEAVKHIPKRAMISSIKKNFKREYAPRPYDILTLQKEMAKKYDFDASKTLDICQKLYDEYHVLSYPRTDSRYYTEDLREELAVNLTKLNFGKFSEWFSDEMHRLPDRYFNDSKVADHHALAVVDPQEGKSIEVIYDMLNDDEKKVFDAVCNNFIALHFPPYEYENVEAIADSGEYKFVIKGRTTVKAGFSLIYGKNAEQMTDEQDLTLLHENQELKLEAKAVNDVTKPKAHYTTASLLDLMKVYNIGTGATRDNILKEILQPKGKNKTSFVKKDGKFFLSTSLGRQINDLIPERLRSMEYLAYLDDNLNKIAEGKISAAEFNQKLITEANEHIKEWTKNAGTVEITDEVETKLKCPVCGKALVDKGGFYGCSGYKTGMCEFTIGKSYFGKMLSESSIEALLTRKRTKKKFKLISKEGNPYEAFLILEIENGKGKVKTAFH